MRIARGSGRRVTKVAGLAAICVICTLTASLGVAHDKLKVGDIPPRKLTGKFNLSDYRGKIVIISFWATWCPPCRKELTMLAQLQKAATRDKVVIFAVNFQQDLDTFWKIERALHGVDLTLVSDPTGNIGNEYDVDSIPHMVIVGRDGRIAAIRLGYSESEIPDLIRQINSLWNAPPAS